MVNRHYFLALMVVILGAMSFISCSTTDQATRIVAASETSAPRIITVLQAMD